MGNGIRLPHTKRSPADYYPTPAWVTRTFLHRYPLPPGPILEPAAGEGHMLAVIREVYPAQDLLAVEIDTAHAARLKQWDAQSGTGIHVWQADFLTWTPPGSVATVITNPPFSLAQAFCEHALALNPVLVAMLLPLSFLASSRRRSFWMIHPVSSLWVLSKRPSFRGQGTSAQDYAWFVWDQRETMPQGIFHLAPLEEDAETAHGPQCAP